MVVGDHPFPGRPLNRHHRSAGDRPAHLHLVERQREGNDLLTGLKPLRKILPVQFIFQPAEGCLGGVLVERERQYASGQGKRSGDRERIEPVSKEPGLVLASFHAGSVP